MAWHGSLDLHYERRSGSATELSLRAERTVGRGVHHGPLRVLQSLYPEAPAVCHHVLVHPPGGIVGGDVLAIRARLDAGTHALVTTPGAARFYRSNGDTAQQRLQAQLAPMARLEWLPLETLVHDAARATNQLRFELDTGADTIGWDVLGLGLPAAGQPFAQGRFEQRIEVVAGGRAVWIDRNVLDFDSPAHAMRTRRLLASPLGWDGQPVLASVWFASGSPLAAGQRDGLLDAARAVCNDGLEQLGLPWGCTAPNPHVVVLRALGPRVEPLLQQLSAVWACWRQCAWNLPPCPPRVWRT